jgi:hypothetical protein
MAAGANTPAADHHPHPHTGASTPNGLHLNGSKSLVAKPLEAFVAHAPSLPVESDSVTTDGLAPKGAATLGLDAVKGVGRGMTNRFLIVFASTAVLLAGCAWGPRVETTAPVTLPVTAGTYRLIGADSATAVDVAVASALRSQLQAKGWNETADAPVWRMEAIYMIRPQKVGGYSDVSARDEVWIVAPALPRWWASKRRVHSLTVILTGPDDSRTTYQASAAVTVRDRTPDAMIDLLAEAVAAELKPAS